MRAGDLWFQIETFLLFYKGDIKSKKKIYNPLLFILDGS